ncbi:MAG: helix-turn-helix transcriptional regulator [Patescibacteria group bacterium]
MARKNNIPHFLFGSFIREYRVKHKLTQQQLANELSIHKSYLSGIERGERNISYDKVCSIVRALKFTPTQTHKILGLKID